jgi:hypothetical protein
LSIRSVSKLSRSVALKLNKWNEIARVVEQAIERESQRIVSMDDMALSISKWAPESTMGQDEVTLNEGQEQAMNMALGRQFQLIQGPPGNHQVLVYCIMNGRNEWAKKTPVLVFVSEIAGAGTGRQQVLASL